MDPSSENVGAKSLRTIFAASFKLLGLSKWSRIRNFCMILARPKTFKPLRNSTMQGFPVCDDTRLSITSAGTKAGSWPFCSKAIPSSSAYIVVVICQILSDTPVKILFFHGCIHQTDLLLYWTPHIPCHLTDKVNFECNMKVLYRLLLWECGCQNVMTIDTNIVGFSFCSVWCVSNIQLSSFNYVLL